MALPVDIGLISFKNDIIRKKSRALLEKYRAEAAKVPGLVVGGRLGGYKYFDMDQSIAAALSLEI